MATAGATPSPLALSAVKFRVSSRPSVEMLGTESAFLLGGFLGVLKEDLEKRGIIFLCEWYEATLNSFGVLSCYAILFVVIILSCRSNPLNIRFLEWEILILCSAR